MWMNTASPGCRSQPRIGGHDDPRPIAEVLDELPRITRVAGDERQPTGVRKIVLDTGPDECYFAGGEGTSHNHGATTGEVLDDRRTR